MKFYERIKELRGEIKQQTFAKRCHIDPSTINKMEKGILTGTLDIHIKICQALKISLSTLYKGVYENKIDPFSPPFQCDEPFLMNDPKITRQLLVKNVFFNKRIFPEILTLLPGSCFKEELPPDSQRFIFTLKGEIQISSSKTTLILKRNQSTYITDAAIPTSFKNKSTTSAKILCVSSPPMPHGTNSEHYRRSHRR